MWAILPLLLASALFSVTVADKADVQKWTEVVREAINRYVSTPSSDWTRIFKLDEDLKSVANQIPTDATYHWVHKDSSGQTWLCGGSGGLSTVKWILDYIIESYPVKAFTPGQASGDDIAVWNIKTDKDTRKCRIQGQFNNGKLTAYTVIYDHESPLV